MKKYIKIILSLVSVIIYILPLSVPIIAKSENETLVTETYDPEQNYYKFNFSTVEETGLINSFAVSDSGRIATCIGVDINIYNAYGSYEFTIYTYLQHTGIILDWENDTLLIYLSNHKYEYKFIKINGYDDYEVYTCPDNEDTKEYWNELPEYQRELITDTGRYYVQTGNLRFEDKKTGADYALTENTSFQPWWLLSIPILTAIIWFGYARKRVKQWELEKEYNKKI